MESIEKKYRILVVDDESYICNIVAEALSSNEKYNVVSFSKPQEALLYLENNRVDLVLTDLVMGDYSGVDILERAFRFHSDCIVILMTAHPTVNNAISVLKKGAYDYLVKPFKLEMLKNTVERGLKQQALARENVHLKEQLALQKLSESIGTSNSLQEILEIAAKTARAIIGVEAVSILIKEEKNRVAIPLIIDTDNSDSEAKEFLSGRHEICRESIDNMVMNSEKISCKADGSKKSIMSCPLISRGSLIGLINIVHNENINPMTQGQTNLFSIIASKVASAIENFQLNENLQNSYLKAIKALANAIEARDPYTRGHTERVTILAALIASRLNWSEEKRAELKMGCTLHDIGKIGIPDAILNKPGKLTTDERAQIKMHPVLGANMLGGIDYMEAAIPYILYHHEKYDGSGYPHGLSGEEIPIEGRLLAVVDTYDAIVSHRPYRDGANSKRAIDELIKYKNEQFDPMIVDILVSVWEEGLIEELGIYHNLPERKMELVQ